MGLLRRDVPLELMLKVRFIDLAECDRVGRDFLREEFCGLDAEGEVDWIVRRFLEG